VPFGKDRAERVVPANTETPAEAAAVDSLTRYSVCMPAVCNTQAKQSQRKKDKRGGFRYAGFLLRLLGSVIGDSAFRLIVENEIIEIIHPGQQQTVQQISAIKQLHQTVFPHQQTIWLLFVKSPDISLILQFGDFILLLADLLYEFFVATGEQFYPGPGIRCDVCNDLPDVFLVKFGTHPINCACDHAGDSATGTHQHSKPYNRSSYCAHGCDSRL
jgi:hypothetical protein